MKQLSQVEVGQVAGGGFTIDPPLDLPPAPYPLPWVPTPESPYPDVLRYSAE